MTPQTTILSSHMTIGTLITAKGLGSDQKSCNTIGQLQCPSVEEPPLRLKCYSQTAGQAIKMATSSSLNLFIRFYIYGWWRVYIFKVHITWRNKSSGEVERRQSTEPHGQRFKGRMRRIWIHTVILSGSVYHHSNLVWAPELWAPPLLTTSHNYSVRAGGPKLTFWEGPQKEKMWP